MSEIDEQTEALRGLHELLGELPHEPEACPDPACPKGTDAPLARLVESFMWWEAGARHAPAAVEKLCAELVDYNELRICLPDEVLAIIGTKYPKGQERCERLNAALNAVYNREHALNLETMLSMPKREARVYLDGLDGITPFIASRVMLLTLGAHAFPVDSRVAGVLGEASIAETVEQPAQIAAKMERLLRAGECREIYLGVERLIETPRKPKAKAEPKPNPEPDSESIADPQAEPETAPAHEPAPDPTPEPVPDSAPEPTPEQSQADPAPACDDEPTPKPHPEPGTE